MTGLWTASSDPGAPSEGAPGRSDAPVGERAGERSGAGERPRFIRRISRVDTLVYHRAECHHARRAAARHADLVEVPEAEVQAAYEHHANHRGPVNFEGRSVLVWTCNLCLRRGPSATMPSWPPR